MTASYADGVFQKNLPPDSLDAGWGNVFLKYDISSRKEADADHTYLRLDLISNFTTPETKKFVTYALTFTNANKTDAAPILREIFHSEKGTLLLDIIHSSPPVTVSGGIREQLLNSYMADPAGNVTVRGLSFDKDVLYHVHVDILTVDNIRILIDPNKMPQTDFYFAGDMPSSAGAVRVVPEFPIAALMFATSIAIIIVTFSVKVAGSRDDAYGPKS